MVKKVTENIRILRESKGYSQDYMAELMGITQSAYARFERGVTKTDLKTIDLIAQALEMSVIDVLTYPDRYVNIKDFEQETASIEPEVILQFKIKGDKKSEILKTMLEDGDFEFL
jgi:transcriptional regulator with XRE-family HTH domain